MNSPCSTSPATTEGTVQSTSYLRVWVSVSITLIKQSLDVSLFPFTCRGEEVEDASQVLFLFPTGFCPQVLNHERLSPDQHIR